MDYITSLLQKPLLGWRLLWSCRVQKAGAKTSISSTRGSSRWPMTIQNGCAGPSKLRKSFMSWYGDKMMSKNLTKFGIWCCVAFAIKSYEFNHWSIILWLVIKIGITILTGPYSKRLGKGLKHMTGRIRPIECTGRSHNGGYLPRWIHSTCTNFNATPPSSS